MRLDFLLDLATNCVTDQLETSNLIFSAATDLEQIQGVSLAKVAKLLLEFKGSLLANQFLSLVNFLNVVLSDGVPLKHDFAEESLLFMLFGTSNFVDFAVNTLKQEILSDDFNLISPLQTLFLATGD